MISSLQQLLVSRYLPPLFPVSFSCCVAFFWSDFWSTIWGACSNVWKWFRVYGFSLDYISQLWVFVTAGSSQTWCPWSSWKMSTSGCEGFGLHYLCAVCWSSRDMHVSFLYPNISNNCATKNSNSSLWILLLAGKITNPILSGANADRWQHLHSPSYCWGMWDSGGEGNGSWGEGLPNMGWGTPTQGLGKPFCK